MEYVKPEDVLSPRDMVNDLEVLYDGGEEDLSIAKLTWGNEKNCIGIRWNVSHREFDDERKENGELLCTGLPQSRGYATWFILPETFSDYIHDYIEKNKVKNKVKR